MTPCRVVSSNSGQCLFGGIVTREHADRLAARLLRVNRKTLYDAVRAGEVPGVVRVGRSIRIGRDALLGWLQGNGSPALGDPR